MTTTGFSLQVIHFYFSSESVVLRTLEKQLELIARFKQLCNDRRDEDCEVLAIIRRMQTEVQVRGGRQLNFSQTRIDRYFPSQQ